MRKRQTIVIFIYAHLHIYRYVNRHKNKYEDTSYLFFGI